MDGGYFSEILLSTLIFAPGLILLGVFTFIGLLTLLEKSGVLRAMTVSEPLQIPYEGTTEGANPAPGAVVKGLNDAISASPIRRRGDLKRKKTAS